MRAYLIHVKPDMVDQWTALVKAELLPAVKKMGVPSLTTYRTEIGTANEFLVVMPFDKFALFDDETAMVKAIGSPEAAAALFGKLSKMEESSSNWITTRMDALGNDSAASTTAPLLISVRVRVSPGKMNDMEAFVKSDLAPAFKKAKAGLQVNIRSFGANPNDIVFSSPIAKFAEFDGPPPWIRALGQEAGTKMVQKMDAYGAIVEQVLRVRVPELSF